MTTEIVNISTASWCRLVLEFKQWKCFLALEGSVSTISDSKALIIHFYSYK